MATDKVYVIGDIHGHLDKLINLHALVDADQDKNGPAPIVHLGDLTDRGPNSSGVISYLVDAIALGKKWVVLKGNHDRMMSLYLRQEPQRDPRLRAELEWLHPRLGGWETLNSYGVDMGLPPEELHREARRLVPELHQKFVANLPLSCRAAGALIVHAGIKPGVELDHQTEDDMLWIREEFHDSAADHGPLIIHGHTPVDQVTHYGNRVNIDTGVAYGGPLSCIVVENRQVWQVTAAGRVAVLPPQDG